MRKKSVSHLFDTIFWHIIYFLPVVAWLMSCLAFGTDSFVNVVADEESSQIESVEVEIDSLTLMGKTVTFASDFNLYEWLGGMGDVSYSLDYFLESDSSQVYKSIAFGMDLYAQGGSQLIYDSTCVFDGGYDADGISTLGWVDQKYRTIVIVGGDDVDNMELLSAFYSDLSSGYIESIEDYVQPSEGTPGKVAVYDYLEETFAASMRVVGYNPDNDVLYATVSRIFAGDEYFSSFQATSYILQFLCYFIYANILHVFVDVLLFIPRLCHKWLKVWTQQED